MVWLSGLPTSSTALHFPKGVTLQVSCMDMDEAPSAKGGVTLANALLHFCMAPSSRDDDFAAIWPILQNTVLGGEEALVHGWSGRHWAGIAGCLFRALLAQEPWDVAVRHNESCRKTLDIPGIVKKEGMQDWVSLVLRRTVLMNPRPAPHGYVAATACARIHLDAVGGPCVPIWEVSNGCSRLSLCVAYHLAARG